MRWTKRKRKKSFFGGAIWEKKVDLDFFHLKAMIESNTEGTEFHASINHTCTGFRAHRTFEQATQAITNCLRDEIMKIKNAIDGRT